MEYRNILSPIKNNNNFNNWEFKDIRKGNLDYFDGKQNVNHRKSFNKIINNNINNYKNIINNMINSLNNTISNINNMNSK